MRIGLIKMSFNLKLKDTAYCPLVRPYSQYGPQFKDMGETKSNEEQHVLYPVKYTDSVSEMLQNLRWSTLEAELRTKIIYFFIKLFVVRLATFLHPLTVR